MPGKNLANLQKWLKNLKTYIQLKENLSEKVFSKMKKSRHFTKIFTKFG